MGANRKVQLSFAFIELGRGSDEFCLPGFERDDLGFFVAKCSLRLFSLGEALEDLLFEFVEFGGTSSEVRLTFVQVVGVALALLDLFFEPIDGFRLRSEHGTFGLYVVAFEEQIGPSALELVRFGGESKSTLLELVGLCIQFELFFCDLARP